MDTVPQNESVVTLRHDSVALNFDRIFLIGPMGVGKTTIGKKLAERLGWEFVDSDTIIEQKTGVRIPTIFELEGEAGFRRREACAIDELTQRPHIVLATGGGAVIQEINRQHLKQRGWCIYLSAAPDALYRRVRNDRNRPLLQTSDPYQKIVDLITEREPWYQTTAHHEEPTGRGSVGSVMMRILIAGGWQNDSTKYDVITSADDSKNAL